MRFDKYTIKAQEAVVRAQEMAQRMDHAEIQPLHLLASLLEETEGIGAPDYADEGMIQYLRTERIIPPYQTRGYKLVELLRIYEAK